MEKVIYLAGGCFWGVEAYFKKIAGVLETQVGYANGPQASNFANQEVTYQEVKKGSGHVEAVKITYDPEILPLRKLLLYLFRVIDPVSVNKQGEDEGIQYRTGVYYIDQQDKLVAQELFNDLARFYPAPLAVELLPLENYWVAEDYHQDYLDKNPNGYCHINVLASLDPVIDPKDYETNYTIEELKEKLSDISFEVTCHAGTEAQYSHQYWDLMEEGVYVDIISGEPLFSSEDKFIANCGWPSFAKPIAPEVVTYHDDWSKPERYRVEVRSRVSGAHLGHVFNDGPKELTGLRYCINGAALKFIPKNKK